MKDGTKEIRADGRHGFEALSDSGLLWLINRVVFHPRGMAMAIVYDDHGHALGWHLQGDGDEVWSFEQAFDDEKFAQAKKTIETHLRDQKIKKLASKISDLDVLKKQTSNTP